MLRVSGMQSRWNPISLKTLTQDLVKPLALGAAAFLTANIQPASGVIPFAWALLAAALMAGVQPLFLLAGCLAATFRDGAAQWSVPVGTAAVAIFAAGAELLRLRSQRRGGRFLQQGGQAEAAVSLLAGAGVLAGGLPLAAGDPWQSLRILVSAVAAAASAPFMMAWIRVGPARRHLLPEERTGLMIFLCAALAGLAAVCAPPAAAAAYAGTLILAGAGPGAGACAGLTAGAAMLLTGGDPARMAALGVCGLAAGLAPPGGNGALVRLGRWAQPLALAFTAPVAALFLNLPPTESLWALAACAGVLAMPRRTADRLRGWLSGERRGACDPDRLALRLRAETGRRLRALSAAFGELAEGYRTPVEIPDEQSLIADMRDRLCDNCSHYEECWAGSDNRAVRFLCHLIPEAIDWSNGDCAHPLFDDDPPPDLLRACRRGRSVPARLGPLLEDFARTRRAEMKRSAVHQLISAQFMQAQLLLKGMADAQDKPMRVRGRHAARARAALDRAEIPVGDVMALRGARSMEIVATLRGGCWSGEQAARAADALSRVFGRAYAPGEGAGLREMKFVRLPRLRASAAAACRPLSEGAPSGDSHMIRMLHGDRLLLMISDGMGSGEAAARESAQTLRLLWQFLSADVDRRLALDTVNELMLARSGEDMFATVDLCIIDLNTGVAEFTKLGACRSYILRKDEILTAEGGRLPLGILEQVRPSVCRVTLQPGDLILMGSDGVMDAITPSTLSSIPPQSNPQLLADTLLSTLPTPDDMTTLICQIESGHNCCRSSLKLDTIAAAQG